jgi:acyl carrier protein
MSPEALRDTILQTLRAVAPEVDTATLADDADIREALDLDSMDVLRFANALHDALGVDVPESDYARIVRVADCVEYLRARMTAR